MKMRCDDIVSGTFIERPDRFIANVRIQFEKDVPEGSDPL